MSSGEDLPASGERSVFIQSAEDGGYVVRIFDQPDVYSDYTVSSGDLSDSIAEKFEGSSELTEKQFKEYLTSNLALYMTKISSCNTQPTVDRMDCYKLIPQR
jgi:predicted RNase H-like HicB family nuclease